MNNNYSVGISATMRLCMSYGTVACGKAVIFTSLADSKPGTHRNDSSYKYKCVRLR